MNQFMYIARYIYILGGSKLAMHFDLSVKQLVNTLEVEDDDELEM